MEKNLNKYVVISEAVDKYVTAQMIQTLVETNKIPYVSDKGVIKVYPPDITSAISEMFGVEERKRKKKEPELTETPEVTE